MSLTVASCAPGTARGGVPSWIKNQPVGISLTDFIPSPDGRLIAFKYTDIKRDSNAQFGLRNPIGYGIYEWQTGKLVPIPKKLYEPTFFDDGKRLLMRHLLPDSTDSQLAEVDLNTFKITPYAPTTRGVEFKPVFQPGTGKVLYVKTIGYFSHLVLFDPKTQTETAILDEKNGFAEIKKPSFIAPDEIIFEADSPLNIEWRKELSRLKIHGFAVYRLKFGSSPELYAAAKDQAKTAVDESGYMSLSATQGGKIVAYISATPGKLTDENGKIIRELYTIENGNIVRRTAYNATAQFARISYDGSIIAFGADLTQPRNADLFIYNMQTGEVLSTGLLEKIRNDPAFILGKAEEHLHHAA